MELAIVIVAGLVLIALIVCVTVIVLALGKGIGSTIVSYRELAKFWSVHALSHTDIDLDKMRLLVEGTKMDIGDIPPRSTLIRDRAVKVETNNADGISATFNNGTLDPMG